MHLEVMQDKCRGKAAPIVYSSQAPGPGVAVGRTLRQYNAAYEGEQMYRWLLILNPLPPNVSTLATTTAILAPPPLKNHPHCTHQDDNKDCGSRIVMIRVPNWVICPTHESGYSIGLRQICNLQGISEQSATCGKHSLDKKPKPAPINSHHTVTVRVELFLIRVIVIIDDVTHSDIFFAGQKFIQLQQQINAQLEYCKLAVAMTLAYNFWLYELYSIYI
ncbi:hypothetical protein SERLA73DRAFT_149216 [Serpula lacrymans var. lacrymans S7.3]|uniref:Uncharacterized protein n=1 Tax=Serpula lacrymans var. lacrymans (strain S7.3) TaxID=936435 RepID=F8PGS1_SERL3|nr:hypothetical protein SERLA73DRAFT_149216 [Serpula lacrymans var. lacrymans S7.3]